MSKTKLWITILLTVIVLALIGWNMTDFSDDTAPGPVNDHWRHNEKKRNCSTISREKPLLRLKRAQRRASNTAALTALTNEPG